MHNQAIYIEMGGRVTPALERIAMTTPRKVLATVFLAASAAAFTMTAVRAASIAAPSSVHIAPVPPVETVQWWGGGPYYDYYTPGYGYGYGWNPGGNVLPPGYAPAPGYERGYQAGAADVAACMERFRSYDPVSRTYMGRDRRRHPCPL